jgi:hypothetical protein
MVKERHPTIPNATNRVGIGHRIVVRVAVVQVHVPGVRAIVLGRTPEAAGRIRQVKEASIDISLHKLFLRG